jgi:carboxylesterase type B
MIALGAIFPNTSYPISDRDVGVAAEHLVSYHKPSWTDREEREITTAYTAGVLAPEVPAFKMTKFGTDFVFLCDTRRAAAALAKLGVPTWVYQFDFHGPDYLDPRSAKCQEGAEVGCGVFHSAELPYVWNRHPDEFTPSEAEVARQMGLWWTNMAKHGTPNAANGANPSELNHSLAVWPEFTASTHDAMVITETSKVVRGLPQFSKCAMWDALPPDATPQ